MQVQASHQQIIDQNQRLLHRLNNHTHQPAEIRQLIGEISGQPIHESVEIRLPFFTDFGRHIQIGRHVFINSNVMFVDLGGICIDDHVLIGPKATIISVNHQEAPARRRALTLKPVHLKTGAWIGAQALILPGVTVGKNAIVGAGAVVTKDVPNNTVVAGNPAQKIRSIKES